MEEIYRSIKRDSPSQTKREIVKLGDCSYIIMGQSPPGESYNDLMIGTPFLQGKAEFGERYPINPKYTTDPRKMAVKDSVLLSVRAPVGDVNIADRDYCIGRGLCSISLKDGDNEFLYYFLLTQKNKLDSEGSGSTFKSINKNNLHSLDIPLPPLEEQQAIARTLRTVQEAQERNEAVIEATRNLKAAMMRHLFTYGPVPIAEREYVSLKETDIGLIPEDWEISSINNLCSLIVDCPHSTPNFTESGYLVIRTSHVKNGHLLLDAPSYTDYEGYSNRITRAEPNEGDILLTREAPIGEACIIPENVKLCLGQRMMLLRPNEAKIDNKFLLYSLYSEQVSKGMKGKGSGVTAPHLNVKEVKDQKIPFPCLSQQRCISQIFNQIDEKIGKEQNIKKSLQKLFDGLLMNSMKKM